ncbi:MAG: beta-N-acetylhexosaminidase, partial [Bacteroidia bacterium]
MPGHSAAFTRTFGVTMQSPKGMEILKKLMNEICTLFDTPYIHIGTDEVRFSNEAFVPQMVNFLRKKGKKIISWNPGWQYKKGEIDKLHLWSYRGKTQKGIPSIDSRYHYLNHFDTFGDIIALYNSKIGNTSTSTPENEGAILAVWNDRKLKDEKQIMLQNNFYPNMLALADRAWQGGGTEYFDKEGTILRSRSSKNYIDFADFERRMLWYKRTIFKGEPFAYTKQTHIEWNITDAFPNNGNLKMQFSPEQQLDTTYTYQNKTYKTHPAYGASVYLRHTWGSLVPGFYKNPQENHTAYAYTWVYADKAQEAGLWVEFQNYSRSEKDLPPLQGTWDYRGSKIWLNDEEIQPPIWQNAHNEKSNEIILQNENLAARKPISVHLKKGW